MKNEKVYYLLVCFVGMNNFRTFLFPFYEFLTTFTKKLYKHFL